MFEFMMGILVYVGIAMVYIAVYLAREYSKKKHRVRKETETTVEQSNLIA